MDKAIDNPIKYEVSGIKDEQSERISFLKCNNCPFITLTTLSNHECSPISANLKCIGCDNTFFSQNVLRLHMLEDHKMNLNEIEDLFKFKLYSNSTKESNTKKKRITLKNVQLLKTPDVPQEASGSKSKIFIKNVQLLRKPDLPQNPIPNIFDFNIQNDFLEEENSFADDFNNFDAYTSLQEENQYENSIDEESGQLSSKWDQIDCDDLIEILDDCNDPIVAPDSTKSKIFIKNISVLKEPNLIQPIINQFPSIHLKSVHELNRVTLDQIIGTTSNNTLPSSTMSYSVSTTPESRNAASAPLDDEIVYLDNFCTTSGNQFPFEQNLNPLNPLQDLMTSFNVPEGQINENDHFIIIPPQEPIDESDFMPIEQNYPDVLNVEEDKHCDQKFYQPNNEEIPITEIVEDQLEMPPTPRIYVAANLMIQDKEDAKISKKTGRPKGAKRLSNINKDTLKFKCQKGACACRFSSQQILDFHQTCHTDSNEDGIYCPECLESTSFKNWIRLHSHLWLYHTIDMDLFKCDLCNYKSSSLSKILNLHMKTHGSERNFKCEHVNCTKSFKNAKQLRNHRRIHRARETKVKPIKIKKKASILPTIGKRFNCTSCQYETNDHNSFRRHNFKHSKDSMYKCPFCDYTSIQSTTYRRHLESKHPQLAVDLLFKCNQCPFVTINKKKFDQHKLKQHDNPEKAEASKKASTKIKVKSNLLLTDPSKINYDFEYNSILSTQQDDEQIDLTIN